MFATGGQQDRLVDPADVVRLLRNGYSSVVVDTSHLNPDDQASYAARLAGEIEAHRVATGLPQWVVMDEAHGPVGRTGTARSTFNPGAKGYLLITWKPGDLSADVLASLDAVLALGSPWPDSAFVDLTAAVAGMPRADIARLLDGSPGRAVLAWRQCPRQPVAFTVEIRVTPHLRHEHKYDQVGAEPAHRFHFRAKSGTPLEQSPPTSPSWKPNSPAATRECCVITAPDTTSPAGLPTSSTTDHSPPTSPPQKRPSRVGAPPQSSNRYV